jgi:hypothetical protein
MTEAARMERMGMEKRMVSLDVGVVWKERVGSVGKVNRTAGAGLWRLEKLELSEIREALYS